MANSVGLHESEDSLSTETKDKHRALTSMMEELEAVDWYDQRVDAATDTELKEILAHNRDEEKEHFVMTLEWLRRRDTKFAEELKERLFTEGSIVAQEAEGEAAGPSNATPASKDSSLGIGSLKGGATL
jgi:ferritin-like protein